MLSPLLGNVYLHYVLDLWFEREVKPRLRGEAHLVRYADDFVMTFETKDDAERVMEVLGKRVRRGVESDEVTIDVCLNALNVGRWMLGGNGALMCTFASLSQCPERRAMDAG